ncbi:MAG: hypothetical protein GX045_07225 [Clostridiaceae bacterium]|nr:hypothetical protein [Clostridiaceae bacterium]
MAKKKDKPCDLDNLKTSLQTLVDSFEAEFSRGYYQCSLAYEKWIEGLLDDTLWDGGNSKDDIERRLDVNDYMLLNLIDARRCAAKYLGECVPLLKGEKADLLTEIVSLYRKITEQLGSFRNKLKAGDGENLRYNAIDTKNSTCYLKEQAELLQSIPQTEKEIAEKAKRIIAYPIQ